MVNWAVPGFLGILMPGFLAGCLIARPYQHSPRDDVVLSSATTTMPKSVNTKLAASGELMEMEFTRRVCNTRVSSWRIRSLNGSIVRVEECQNPGLNTAVHRGLWEVGDMHWCLQEYMEIPFGNNTFRIPSGCSLWIEDSDGMPMDILGDKSVDKAGTRMCKVRRKLLRWPAGVEGINAGRILELIECEEEGLNTGTHSLGGHDHWCRQQTISLPFAGDYPLPSGCSCYVRDDFLNITVLVQSHVSPAGSQQRFEQ